MIDIRIGTRMPDLELRVPADRDGLPVVRQALRSLGESVGAHEEALEDAELAVTEACANAVEHAYSQGGDVEVEMHPHARAIKVIVRDRGRGMPRGFRARRRERGYGMSLIEGIATESEVREGPGGGTEVVMSFEVSAGPLELSDGAQALLPVERVVRRVVAVVAAQADLPADRLFESLLVAELLVRHAPRRLLGMVFDVTLERLSGGMELSVGPLEAGGADAVIADTQVAVIGSVVERLADGLRTLPGRDRGERLAVRLTSGAERRRAAPSQA